MNRTSTPANQTMHRTSATRRCIDDIICGYETYASDPGTWCQHPNLPGTRGGLDADSTTALNEEVLKRCFGKALPNIGDLDYLRAA